MSVFQLLIRIKLKRKQTNKINKSKYSKSSDERRSASWDIQNAPNNYISLILTQTGSAFFSFASVWVITQYLGTENYGNVVAIIAASQIAQVLINWSCIALSKFGTEELVERGDVSKPFWTRTFILMPNLFLIIPVAFFWFESLSHLLKIPSEVFSLVLAHFIATILWLHIQFALQGAKLMRLQGFLQVVERIIVFLILIILILTGSITWLSALWAFVVAPIAMILIGFWQLKNLIFPIRTFDFGYLKKMLLFSVPLIPYSLVGYFSTSYIDVFFVSFYLTKLDVGIYSVNYQIAGMLMQIPILAGNLLLPFFVTLYASQKGERANLYLAEILPFICFFWCLACAILATLVGIFLPLIFGEKFAEHKLLFWILAAAVGLGSPYLWGYGAMANAKSLTYITLTCAIVSAFSNLVLNYFLVPRFGLLGCAWATVVAYVLSSTAVVVLLNKHLQLKKNWVVQATLPILLGAIIGTWKDSGMFALAATFFFSSIIFLLYCRRISEAFGLVRNLFFKRKIFT